MATLANGIVIPASSGPADPVALLTLVANGFSDSIGGLGTGKRQPRRYSVANQTEKGTIAGLTTLAEGDQVYLIDTKWWETYYTTGGWKVTKTTVAITMPLAATGIVQGAGSVANFTYSVDGDMVWLRGIFTMDGATTFPITGGSIILPFIPAYAIGVTSTVVIGTALAQRTSTQAFYQGVVTVIVYTSGTAQNYALINFDNGLANGVMSPLSSSSPFAWGAGDQFSLDIRYRRK